MSTSRRVRLLRSFFVAILIAVFVVALLPTTYEPKIVSWQDKVEHVLTFFTITLLGAAAWPGRFRTLAAGILTYGAAIEIAQSFTSWRSCDVRDWVADAAGVLAAAVVAQFWNRSRRA
ncbi:VanZ family protein [Azoarcus sp. KH32C]|uniref:VanZ family protein n=1 Tax=Azoarcus sp. KH32C TaxID=748247 RepID=UPI0002386EB5|nr:VanZ family protein [Azoarcus sp. KH32C]BAL24429.1 VanZ family protein [Azoarcus sp. KH32C]